MASKSPVDHARKAALIGLKQIKRRRTIAENALAGVRLHQDAAVESALQAGLDIATIARALGVSRFTIYHRRKSK